MNAEDFDFLREFVRVRSGIVIGPDKQYLVESRLGPIARKTSGGSIAALVGEIRASGGARFGEEVVDAMTTNESFFFRDKIPFENFTEVMLPALLAARASVRRLRIWSAAASTGQECYSLAMLLKERAAQVAGWQIDILGTDLSREVLDRARSGVYTQFEVQRGLAIQMLLKYFSQNGDQWIIAPEIRKMVEFKRFNLIDRFTSLGNFDVVFCRNVLIYFDHPTKVDILERIAALMPDDGYLVLGAAETVVGLTDAFRPVPERRGLYMRVPGHAAAKPKIPAPVTAGFAATPPLAPAGAFRRV